MTLSNLDYLYEHLPARMRRDDALEAGGTLFLKRFLSVLGEELDGFDLQLDTFFEKISPETAPIEFIDWWLYAFFGWGWFPEWFTLPQRRAFYAAIAQHYAERGTLAGIRHFLAAFGLRVIVEAGPQFYSDSFYGENVWNVTGPLGIMVRLFPEAPAVNEDLEIYDEAFYSEAFPATSSKSIQRADIDELLRFQWPLAQWVYIERLPFGDGLPHTGYIELF